MIGIFDSGIGGVTVLKELIKKMPQEKYIYYSDSKNCPYGDKSTEELKSIVSEVIVYLINKGCNTIIIACNTASTLSEYLREKFDVLIIAIEPAYKMVYDYAYDKKTLVLATKRTIESEKFKTLFEKYDNHKTIIHSCSGLADLIEKGNNEEIDEYLKNNLSQFVGVECVVLGCTHYPLIKENIRKVLGDVIFFDGSLGVSNRTYDLLSKSNLLVGNNGSVQFFDSSYDLTKKNRFFEILYN